MVGLISRFIGLALLDDGAILKLECFAFESEAFALDGDELAFGSEDASNAVGGFAEELAFPFVSVDLAMIIHVGELAMEVDIRVVGREEEEEAADESFLVEIFHGSLDAEGFSLVAVGGFFGAGEEEVGELMGLDGCFEGGLGSGGGGCWISAWASGFGAGVFWSSRRFWRAFSSSCWRRSISAVWRRISSDLGGLSAARLMEFEWRQRNAVIRASWRRRRGCLGWS